MDYEKKYNEALNWMRELYPGLHGATKEDAEHYFPELKESKESEDEKIRKLILEIIKACDGMSNSTKEKCISYLEKQKEQPKEELVYRLNGLMQEYIKEGENDAEKEHRLKCYQLFWDALEDADFFEQKEQKPNHDKEKLIKHCIGMILTDATEKRFKDYGLTLKDCLTWLSVQKEQKPAEKSEYERIRKAIVTLVKDLQHYSTNYAGVDPTEMLAWLEEQKSITINQDEKEFLADEITAFLCNYDKEFDGEDPVPSEVAEHFYLLGKQAQEQKPAEWSEDIIRKGIKEVGLTQYQINWLKNNVFPPKK